MKKILVTPKVLSAKADRIAKIIGDDWKSDGERAWLILRKLGFRVKLLKKKRKKK